MNEVYFMATKKRFEEAGLNIVSADYHSSAFGSCYIEINANPNCRFVWNGKDGYFVVEKLTNEIFNDLPVWELIWSGELAGESQYQQAFKKVIEHCNANA